MLAVCFKLMRCEVGRFFLTKQVVGRYSCLVYHCICIFIDLFDPIEAFDSSF